MLIVLSPAKSLDLTSPLASTKFTQPDFLDASAQLIDTLKTYSPPEISSLMRVSDALALLNTDRYASWSRKFTRKNARQAIFTFNGDVYDGLNAASFDEQHLKYAQSHIRILSGLYGVLRPLDLMQPYRLEMSTRLQNVRGKDLYAFWGDTVTEALNKVLVKQKTEVLVNLASEEYFKAVKPRLLAGSVITPIFKDWNGGKYKIISFYAKRARGLMARYATLKGITQVKKLQAFNLDGYAFHAEESNEISWVFRRKMVA